MNFNEESKTRHSTKQQQIIIYINSTVADGTFYILSGLGSSVEQGCHMTSVNKGSSKISNGFVNPYIVRIYKSVGNFGRSLID